MNIHWAVKIRCGNSRCSRFGMELWMFPSQYRERTATFYLFNKISKIFEFLWRNQCLCTLIQNKNDVSFSVKRGWSNEMMRRMRGITITCVMSWSHAWTVYAISWKSIFANAFIRTDIIAAICIQVTQIDRLSTFINIYKDIKILN